MLTSVISAAPLTAMILRQLPLRFRPLQSVSSGLKVSSVNAGRTTTAGQRPALSASAFRATRPLPQSSRTFTTSSPRRHLHVSPPIQPHTVTPRRAVPSHITPPEYAIAPDDPYTRHKPDPRKSQYNYRYGIELKTPVQIELMRDVCELVAYVRHAVKAYIRPGVTTDYLDGIVHNLIISLGAYPSPLLYANFPKSCCTSVNQVICHGIPDTRPLEEGDILNIDISAYLHGYHGDCSGMYVVGQTDEAALKLVATTEQCVALAIQQCKPQQPLTVIGSTIEQYATQHNYEVVKPFCGHGIGREFHIPPLILHYTNVDPQKILMQPGMVFTIEPALVEGSSDMYTWKDNWTVQTTDNSRCAQHEETIAITEDGAEVLTMLKADKYEQQWREFVKQHPIEQR